MFVTIDQAAFITKNSNFLFNTSFFMLFIGFLYGYAISFVFGIKRTIKLGIFFISLIGLIVMFIAVGYLFTKNCSELLQGRDCSDVFATMSALAGWTFYIIAHFFINFLVGYLGIGIGVGLRFPTEWISQHVFHTSMQFTPPVQETQGKVYESMDRTPTNRINTFISPTAVPSQTLPASQQPPAKTSDFKPRKETWQQKENWSSVKR